MNFLPSFPATPVSRSSGLLGHNAEPAKTLYFKQPSPQYVNRFWGFREKLNLLG